MSARELVPTTTSEGAQSPPPGRPAGAGTGRRTTIATADLRVGSAQRQAVLLANGLAQRGERAVVRLLGPRGPLAGELDRSVRLSWRPYWLALPGLERDLLITGTAHRELVHGAIWRKLNPFGRWVVANYRPAGADTFTEIEARLIRGSDQVLYLSAGQRDLQSQHQQLDGGSWRLIRHGVAPATGRSASARADAFSDPGVVRIVSIGSLDAGNGVRSVLAALSEGLDDLDWRFDIFGEGPDREALAELIPHRLDARIHLRGAYRDPAAALAGAQLLVLPSRQEADALVVLEAMAAGIPVVASAEAAIPELPLDAAVLVAPSTPEGWRESLRTVIRDYDLRGRLAAQGRALAQTEFSVDAMVEDYLQLRRDLTGR